VLLFFARPVHQVLEVLDAARFLRQLAEPAQEFLGIPNRNQSGMRHDGLLGSV
jgi:hypothetical protein